MSLNLEIPKNNMRERVDKDDPEHKLAEELAYKEKEMREKLEERGMPKENISDMADEISTIELEKIEAQKESRLDAMTNLRNKRALYEDGVKILSLEKRKGKECSILMLDFDFFKKVNDEFGHRAGDDALKSLAMTIKKNIRESDFAYRYGGEEFVVILPETSSSEAFLVAEKIRKAVENEIIKVYNEENNQLKLKEKVSIGVSGTDQIQNWKEKKSEDIKNFLEEMLGKADAALYNSKESGRNRTTVYSKSEKK